MWKTILSYAGIFVSIAAFEYWQWYRAKWACESAIEERVESRLDRIESSVMFKL